MNKILQGLTVLLLLLSVASCTSKQEAAPKDGAQPQTTQLSIETVIGMANAEAEKQGYTLVDYLPPDVNYDSSGPAKTWTVIYAGKVDTPGNHFLVIINDKSLEIKLVPGE